MSTPRWILHEGGAVPISDVVNITVIIQDAVVSQAGFGTMLITGHSTTPLASGESATYTTPAEMTAAGWSTSAPEYLAAVAAFSATIRPSQVKVGRLPAFVAQVTTVDLPTGAAADGVYSITITPRGQPAVTYSHTAAGGTGTGANIITALYTLIDAGSQPVTVVDTTDDLTLTADVAGQSFTVTLVSPASVMTQAATTANTGNYQGLVTLAAFDDDWYGLYPASNHTTPHIIEAAAYIEAVRKIHMAQSAEADLLTNVTTDAGGILRIAAYARTAVVYHDDNTEHLGAAWMAGTLSVNPDVRSTTWAHKTLPTIPVDVLTTTIQGYLDTDNVNYYVSLGGNGSTYPGKMSDGTYIDNVVAADWFHARLTEVHQARFLEYSNAGKKIPFTDAGITIIQADAMGIVKKGITVGHFFEDEDSPTYTFPKRADISAGDVAARHLDYALSVKLAGAIHTVSATASLVV